MNGQKRHKRKMLNFSVKREMQFRMIWKIFLLLFISLLLSSGIFYVFSHREVTASYQMFHIKARNFLDFLLPAVLGSFVISLVVGAVGSLFFPKPIAGGIYRIEQDVQKVLGQGDLTVQINLRNGDQVASLAQEINALLVDYRSRIGRIDKTVGILEGYFAAGTPRHGNEDLQTAKQACDAIRSELRQLRY